MTSLQPLELAELAARTSRSVDTDPADLRVMLSECAQTIRTLVADTELAKEETAENLLYAVDQAIAEQAQKYIRDALEVPDDVQDQLRQECRKRDRRL